MDNVKVYIKLNKVQREQWYNHFHEIFNPTKIDLLRYPYVWKYYMTESLSHIKQLKK